MASTQEKIAIMVEVIGGDVSVKDLEKVGTTTDKIKKRVEKLDRIKAAPTVAIRDTASKAIDGINKKLINLGKGAVRWGGRILGAFTAIAGGFGAKAIYDQFTSFEQGMSNVQAVANATKEEMESLRNLAKDIGKDTKNAWSGVEALQGMELLAQAGYTTEEIYRDLTDVLNLATAGSMELAQATEIGIVTSKNFASQGVTMKKVSDVLAKGANSAAMNVQDIGEAMKYVGPVAASLGMDIEQTTAAIGGLADAGIKGSQAGTVLRAALSRLATQRGQAEKYLKDLGIAGFDAQGNLKPFPELIGDIADKTKHLTREQKANAVANIFGTNAMAGMLALIERGPEAIAQLTNELYNSEGAAQKFAEIKMDNLGAQVKAAGDAVDILKQNLGERLGPYAEQGVRAFVTALPAIEDGIMNAVDWIVEQLPRIKEGFNSVKTFIQEWGTTIAGAFAGIQIGNLIAKFMMFLSVITGGAATFSLWPIALAVAIGAALGFLWQHREAVVEFFTGIGEFILEKGSQIVGFIGSIIGGIVGAFEFVASGVGAVLNGAVGIITSIFGGIIGFIINAGATIVTGFIGALIAIPGGVISIGSQVFSILGTWAGQGLNAAVNFVSGIVSGILGGIGRVVGAVTSLAKRALGAFTSFFKIQSPSKTMENQSAYLASGTAEGIRKNANEPVKRIQEMNQDIKDESDPEKDFPIITPKPSGEGGGGISLGGVSISVQDNGDVHAMVREAQEEFGAALLEAILGRV